MNKFITVFTMLAAIVVSAVFLALMPLRLPAADNTTPPQDKITHFYSAEELESVFNTIELDNYGCIYQFENLNDLKHLFKFECVRDPSIYSAEYYPYVVLMSESGNKLFLFYDPQTLEIVERNYIDRFLTLEQIETYIDDAVKKHLPISFFRSTLSKYSTGSDSSGRFSFFEVELTDGVLVVCLHNGGEIKISSRSFYSNEQLLGPSPVELDRQPFSIWTIFPIDKVNSSAG